VASVAPLGYEAPFSNGKNRERNNSISISARKTHAPGTHFRSEIPTEASYHVLTVKMQTVSTFNVLLFRTSSLDDGVCLVRHHNDKLP
jgi:hypothetical protein